MSKDVINLDGVRRGDAHLKRAKELNPDVTKRPVPAGDIANGRRAPGRSGAAKSAPAQARNAKPQAARLTLTVPEAAQLVGLHPITVRREIAAGRLRAAHSGRRGHYRISRADVETWWRSRGGGVLFESAEGSVPAEHLADFLAQAEALTRRLEAVGFAGLNGADVVNAGRAQREQQLGE